MMTGCGIRHLDLILVWPESPVDYAVAMSLAEVFSRESDLRLTLTNERRTEQLAINALVEGSADVAVIANSMPYQEGSATVIPIYA